MQILRVIIPKDSPLKSWADKWISEQVVKEKCSQEDFDEIYEMFNAKEDIEYSKDWNSESKVYVGIQDGNIHFLLERARQKRHQKLPDGALLYELYHPLNVSVFPFNMHIMMGYPNTMSEMRLSSDNYENKESRVRSLKFAEKLKERTIIDYYIDDENGLMFRIRKEDFTDSAKVDLQLFESLLSSGKLNYIFQDDERRS